MNMPIYEGQPMSFLARVTPPDSELALWQWGPSYKPLQGDIDTINALVSAGYQRVIHKPDAPEWPHLLSQCCDVALVRDGDMLHLWARPEDIDFVTRHPVSLAFTLEEPKPDEQHIAMLQFLPLPRTGEWALVDNGKGELI